jgi:hypothetical protein
MSRAAGVLPLAGVLLCGWLVAACGGTAEPSANQQAFLAAVHQQAPDVGNYRSDTRVVALGQAVCNDLAAGVSVSDIASRLYSSSLPSPDLGAVMSAASQVLCPKYASAFSGG